MSKIKIDHILFDMDGVMCNFVDYVQGKIQVPVEQFFNTSEMDQFMHTHTRHYNLFEQLDPLEDFAVMRALFKRFHCFTDHVDVSVCTMTAGSHTHAAHQKTNWLLEHGMTDLEGFLPNLKFTTSQKGKSVYANSRTLLIDDSHGCCTPFIAAGGHAIQHKDAFSTIKTLYAKYEF